MTVKNCPSEELQLPESPVDKKKNEEVIPVENDSDTDDYSEDILDLKLHNDNNNEIANNAQFNITSSQHVVIGNVTHVHGALTINQNAIGNEISINSEEEAAKIEDVQYLDKPKLIISKNTIVTNSTASSTARLKEDPIQIKTLTKLKKCYKRLRYLFLIIIALLLVTCITIPFVIPKRSNYENSPLNKPTSPPLRTTTESEGEYGSYLGTHKLMYKKDWHGYPSKNNTKVLNHPTKTVIISHSVTPFCTSKVDCSLNVRGMQDYHVSNFGSPDVGYNFMIGGDGNIYVGRGWDIVNFQQDDSIGINFIGNFIYDELSESMIEAAELLIEQGVKRNKLAIDYEIISHNSTMPTESPGPNVFKVIKTWPHFSEKNYVKPK